MFRKKNRLAAPTAEERQIIFFCVLSALAMTAAIARAVYTRGASIRESLFWNGVYSDHIMDFVNTLRDSRDFSWVWQRNVIYPPLSVLLMHFLSRLIPAPLINSRFVKRYLTQGSAALHTVYFAFAALCILLLGWALEKYMREKKISPRRYAAIFFLIVNFPVIYCLERGNLSLLAMTLCCIFIFFRNSESAKVREISYLCLAAAAGLKLFPALFGILLLYDKKFKAAARTVCYGIAAVLLPYLLMLLLTPSEGTIAQRMAQKLGAVMANGGLLSVFPRLTASSEIDQNGTIFRFIQNLFRWNTGKRDFTFDSTSIMNVFYLLARAGVLPEKTAKLIGYIVFGVAEAGAAVMGYFSKREWQRVFFVSYLMLNIHAISMHYTLIYLIAPLALFLALGERPERRKINYVYTVLFGLQFFLLPFYFSSILSTFSALFNFILQIPKPESANKLISFIAFQILFFVAAGDFLAGLGSAKREKKKLKKMILVRRANGAPLPARTKIPQRSR